MKISTIKDLISRGYLYCMDCDAFTPHISAHNPEWSWTKHKKACEICGNEVNPGNYSTCECGYDFEHDMEDPDFYDHTFHGEGCHFGVSVDYIQIEDIIEEDSTPLAIQVLHNFLGSLSIADNKRLRHQILLTKNQSCGCRKVRVYRNTPVLSYRSWHGNSMDCMHHIEWEFELQCPVCRRKHYVQDGNC